MKALADYFNLTEEQVNEMDIELHENTGSTGEMPYSLYFYVPQSTPQEVLEEKGWEVGQLITDIPTNIFDSENEWDGSRPDPADEDMDAEFHAQVHDPRT